MFHGLMAWLQEDLGKTANHDSWSQMLLGSLNFWTILEGTHLLTLMLFAGTIMIVDLRMLGVVFKKTPYSVLSDKLLPMTIAGFIVMMITGVMLFFASPEAYYHNVWFRFKVVFMIAAVVNLAFFHNKIQKTQAAWDNAETPPPAVRRSAAISLICWTLVIGAGRFIPYSWYNCGSPQNAFINAVEECSTSATGALPLDKE